jgi:hypothetical protein
VVTLESDEDWAKHKGDVAHRKNKPAKPARAGKAKKRPGAAARGKK